MDRVELIVQLTGDQDAIRSLQRIKVEMNALKNTKVQLQIDKYQLDREIAELNRRIRELTHERRRIQLDGGNVEDVNRQIHTLQDELNELTAQRKGVQLDIQGIDHAVAGLKEAGQELENARSKAEQFGDALTKIGSAMTGAGNFLTSISGIFDTNILDTMERYLTIMGTRMFAQNWGDATKRFDILSTYADYLAMVGVSAEEADASLEKINSKIQGIPVGLSDVAYQTRMYQMYLDDMERATNLAIGLNRALIAGGANEQMRHTAQYEIDRLLATGTLNTSRQWRALIQGLGVSGRFLREAMGYGDMSQNAFIDALFNKEISGDEFIKGIEKLADAQSLNQALDIYKTTIESGLSNIYFALTRGKANILSALDESLETGTGRNISGWLLEIRDGINEVYAAASGWIRDNPEAIAAGVNKILEVFERLAAFDWLSLVEKVGAGIGQYLDILMMLYDAIPDGMFEEFITFAMVWAGPIGNALRILGGAATALGNALKFLATNTGVFNDIMAIPTWMLAGGGIIAAYAAMMAGYALEAKNAEYVLRDYKNDLDSDLGGFKSRLSASAQAGDISGLEKELEALNAYREERQQILDQLKEQRDQLQESGNLDYSNMLIGQELVTGDAADLAEYINKIAQEKEQIEGAIALYSEYRTQLELIKKAKEAAAMDEAFGGQLPDIPEEQMTKLSNLIGKWSELGDAVQQTIDKQIAGFAKIEEVTAVGIDELTENLQSQVDALNGFAENLAGIDRVAAEMGGARGEALAQIAGEIAEMGLDGAGFAQGLNDALNDVLSQSIETQDWTAIDALLNVWQERLDAEDVAVDMSAFAQTFAENFYEALEVAFENLEGFGSVADLIFGNLEEGGTLEAIDGMLEKLEGLQQAVSDDGLTGDVGILNDTVTALTEETLPITAENMDLLTEAVVRLRDEGLVPAKAATDELTQAILELIAALERLFNLIQSKLGVLQQFIAHLRETAAAAREAAAAVQELAAAIDALHDKTVTIGVNIVGAEGLGDLGGGFHTGGLVDKTGKAKYFASGGLLGMFQPRGTDTIPAMLTPGEYVMRRGAVEQLGVPFLQRLNRLDIAGALDNLMRRFYRPSAAAYSVVNNNADNRAYTVNVTNNRASEDYTYRVAAHFAHAL